MTIHWLDSSERKEVACGAVNWTDSVCIAIGAVTCGACLDVVIDPDHLIIYSSGASNWLIERQGDKTVLVSGTLDEMLDAAKQYSRCRRATPAEEMARNPPGIFFLDYKYGNTAD